MSADASADQDADESDLEFAEIDPTNRYGRYKEVLGKGAFKTVYRAFDELEGIEVAWNQIKIADVLRNSDDLDRLYSEVHLLKTLKHKNIIKFYNSWVDSKHGNVNIITEIFTSGTLRQYRKKHKRVDLRALKNWSRQILRGLLYLHSHDPPVIHRDLKCDNIFVNGNQGEVKIGDLGLAAILRQAHAAHSVIGTPEFMAPELYEEEYNELVDIYAFGMCLLELVTFEYPYIECANAAQIYKKVTAGIKPASLEKVKDPGVREFIEKCIANVSERLPARELLMDPFLQSDGENDSIGRSLRPDVARSACSSKESTSSEEPSYHDNILNLEISETMIGSPSHSETVGVEYRGDQPDTRDSPLSKSEGSRDFTVESQRKDVHTIFLKLCIADSKGHVRNIHFPFDIEADTAIGVASEMVTELDLTDQDVTTIAAMIDLEIQAHVPEWEPGESFAHNFAADTRVLENHDSEINGEVCLLSNDPDHPPGQLVLERLPSGRKYWSDFPKQVSEGSPAMSARSNLSPRLDTCIDDSCSTVYEQADTQDGQNNEIGSLNGVVSLHQGDSSSTHKTEDIRSTDFECKSTSSNRLQKKHVVSNDNLQLDCNKKGSAAELYHGLSFSSISAKSSLEDSYNTSMENEPPGIYIIARKLEHLLGEQKKELEELKRKHQLEIRELLKELPPELRNRTVSMCLQNARDCNMHNEVCGDAISCLNILADESYINANSACSKEPHDGSDEIDVGARLSNDNAKDNGFLVRASSGGSIKTFVSESEQAAKCDLNDSFSAPTTEDHHHPKGADLARNTSFSWIVGKGRKQDSIVENHALAFRDGSSLLKGITISSDVGIAVILGDNLAKSVTEGESM